MLKQINEKYVRQFGPFWFVLVMGTGISSLILHSFPYEGRWLRYCSYPMFAVACILFLIFQLVWILNAIEVIRKESWHAYCLEYFQDLKNNVFWGTYPMGLCTIINYMFLLSINEAAGTPSARRLIYLVYALWWYDLLASLMSAWGVSFVIWKDHYYQDDSPHPTVQTRMMRENLQSVLLLPVVPLVVVASSCGLFTMSDLFAQTFNRNIQLITLVVTAIVWFHAVMLVVLILGIYVWNLYVNKIPSINIVFTMFICVGPMGQGAFGILLFTDNIKKYVELYYPISSNIQDEMVKTAVVWSFKIFGLLMSLCLISFGIFLTLVSVGAIVSYFDTATGPSPTFQIVKFHKGWWAMTFPLGTMALGTKEFYIQYSPYVPISAIKVVSAIYSVSCVLITLLCLIGTAWIYLPQQELRELLNRDDDSTIKSEGLTV